VRVVVLYTDTAQSVTRAPVVRISRGEIIGMPIMHQRLRTNIEHLLVKADVANEGTVRLKMIQIAQVMADDRL
jgi:hypothetical protein